MSINVTTICNIALTKLGASRITSLTDESEEGILCNLLWEPIRDEVLRTHPWNCAVHYQSLAEVASGDGDYLLGSTYDYAYQYRLPQDPYCLRALEIPDYPDYPYEIAGRSLLCNLEAVTLKYIKRVIDPTFFDSLLVFALAYRLAAELTVSITNSTKTYDQMFRIYEFQVKRAGGINGIEQEYLEQENEDWENAGR
jgi:hypothetical protein